MISKIFYFACSLCFAQLALSSIVAKETCEMAFKRCDFTFEGANGVPSFQLGVGPDTVFTTRIISKIPGNILGVLNSNGIVPEFILDSGVAAKITGFGNPPFSPTHFKPYSIEKTGGSGIGYETFQGNQGQVARGQCMRIFFTEYQVLDAAGNVIDNRNNVPREANKCVVYRTNPN